MYIYIYVYIYIHIYVCACIIYMDIMHITVHMCTKVVCPCTSRPTGLYKHFCWSCSRLAWKVNTI